LKEPKTYHPFGERAPEGGDWQLLEVIATRSSTYTATASPGSSGKTQWR
jgi:hypothetical protein